MKMIKKDIVLNYITHFYHSSISQTNCRWCLNRSIQNILIYCKDDDMNSTLISHINFTCKLPSACSRIMKHTSSHYCMFDFIVIRSEIDNISLVLLKCKMPTYLRRYILECFILSVTTKRLQTESRNKKENKMKIS